MDNWRTPPHPVRCLQGRPMRFLRAVTAWATLTMLGVPMASLPALAAPPGEPETASLRLQPKRNAWWCKALPILLALVQATPGTAGTGADFAAEGSHLDPALPWLEPDLVLRLYDGKPSALQASLEDPRSPCLRKPMATLGQSPDLSSLSAHGTLALWSHGTPGAFWTEQHPIPFEEVLAALLDPHRGLPPTFQGVIQLLGCELGLRPAQGGPDVPTVVERLAGALAAGGRGGFEVMGALGVVVSTGKSAQWECVAPPDVLVPWVPWPAHARLAQELMAFYKGNLQEETRQELVEAGIDARLYGAHPRLGDRWIPLFGWREQELCPASQRWAEATLREHLHRFNATKRFGSSQLFQESFEARYQCLAVPLQPEGGGRWEPCRKAPALERTGAQSLLRARAELLDLSPSGICEVGWEADQAQAAPTTVRYMAAAVAYVLLIVTATAMATPAPEALALDDLEAGPADREEPRSPVPLLSERRALGPQQGR